ncbi:hypothetical protein [Methylobacterium goesingense]|uniref:Uncharacterized protein n=1 Tax=Methylobacterium goesingense TaxID=243690 RepID=A0ABV2LFN3_9HYPH|nr:hypothetical protein [Methylobacterium goesingense]GJD76717.1 hypothetical protein CFIICLFH_4976 [Methylobacterium goesingense]
MSASKIARNKNGDDLLKVLGPLAHRITSNDWQVYADQAGYERLIRGEKEGCSVSTYSLLRPSIFAGFKQALVASACMTDTMFYRLFTAQGIVLKPVGGRLSKDLRYLKHEHGDRITILYAAEEAWSKRYRDKRIEGEEATVLDRVRQAVGALVGSEPFIWMGNTDLGNDFFAQVGADRLPNTPHGLNSYQGHHNVVVLSALNPPPAHFGFMEGRGISGEEVRTAHYRTAAYQAVMRCSIRNPADTTLKRVVVMDRDTAEWLADLFPGAAVEPLPGMGVIPRKGKAGRPRQHANGAAKAQAHRDGEKRKLLAQLDLINATSLATGRYPFFDQEVRAEMREFARDDISLREGDSVTASPTPSAPPLTCGTAFGSIYDSVPLDHVDYEDDDAFVAGLLALHERVVAKADAGVFSPAHFDPSKATGTGRGLDNVTHLRGIWLDNDGGDLTHAAFVDLFPYLRIVVWNTASSTAALPRWRAFIPTSCAMSMDVHALILGQIERVLNRAGFWGKRQLEKRPSIKDRRCHGFDESKFNAASLFYLPCQPKDPADAFFIDYGDGDPKRGPLDLHQWIETCILSLRPDPEPIVPATSATTSSRITVAQVMAQLGEVRQALAEQTTQTLAERRAGWIAEAVERWHGTAVIPGTGHAEFFRLGAALHRAGLDESELRTTLYAEAGYARSPHKRRGEIKGILTGLRRRGTIGRAAR